MFLVPAKAGSQRQLRSGPPGFSLFAGMTKRDDAQHQIWTALGAAKMLPAHGERRRGCAGSTRLSALTPSSDLSAQGQAAALKPFAAVAGTRIMAADPAQRVAIGLVRFEFGLGLSPASFI